MKKRPRPRVKKAKVEPSAAAQFQAAMRSEEDLESTEARRLMVINVIVARLAQTFPVPPEGLSVVSIDVNEENILEAHECVRCATSTKSLGFIRLDPGTVCIYPICTRCGKMSSRPGTVSEEVEQIVYATLGIEQ